MTAGEKSRRSSSRGAAERLLQRDDDAMTDRELLESLLDFAMTGKRAVPRQAEKHIHKFGNAADVIAEESQLLQASAGLSLRAVLLFRLVRSAAVRLAREELLSAVKIGSTDDVLAYCRTTMARLRTEQFRVLFLNTRNGLIADEILQKGTVDQVAVYPREIIRRALVLSASAFILVHNHPSGDPMPSAADLQMTERIVEMAASFDLRVFDHLIVGRYDHVSFRQRGLLRTAV